MATQKHNEMTRVQMPAIVHLTRLGYVYYGRLKEEDAGTKYDIDTNILVDVFEKKFKELNPGQEGKFKQVLNDIKMELNNDDLGRSFYKRLLSMSPVKLIDFDHPEKNDFHVTGEFTCKNDQDEFRPDVTIFVNGLPLCFIEVKKPNNPGGMLAESNRMNKERFPNSKFRRFINITQLMIFSNNQEYSAQGGIIPIQGVFYCTAAREKAKFNVFREENPLNKSIAPYNEGYPYKDIDPEVEKRILTDFNCQVLHTAPEYQTNLKINSPTNRVITSMCAPERFLFLLKYGFAYVNDIREVDGRMVATDEKHVMRYQQFFASLTIRDKIDKGMKSGVVWHTQGSGKTALAYHLNYVLSDYFAKQNKVAKFYFIVDRLDLLEQATLEFVARGLEVKTASTRKELMDQFKTQQSLEGDSGKKEITVVNIQRFMEDSEKIEIPPYATNLQRIFIVDEAHRGYRPGGSFLLNLFNADPNSIKIALTGTPLLKEERASWKVFSNYYHTYYYDKSIQDGYTLKIIREPIETSYKKKLEEIYHRIETLLVQKRDVPRHLIIEHESYVKELTRYLIYDLKSFRENHGDKTLGGMMICETSDQARNIFKCFNDIQKEVNETLPDDEKTDFKVGLILHDSDDVATRKEIIRKFKKDMTVDMLIVYNMLLTGFDAPRLKRLYLSRKLQDHNLLQAITRVNRPYKSNRYGYIIDFADIKRNFEDTNREYLEELNKFNDPDQVGEDNVTDPYLSIIEDTDALVEKMKAARQVLFSYPTDNAEDFTSALNEIDFEHKDKLIKLKNALTDAKDSYNVARTFGDKQLKEEIEKLKINRLSLFINEVQRRIDIVNQMEALKHGDETTQIVNEALKNITFKFTPQRKEELRLVDSTDAVNNLWHRTVQGFADNIDPKDPKYISLFEAFKARFKERGFVIESADDYTNLSRELSEILSKLDELKRINDAIGRRYNGDHKFVRVHKRIMEANASRLLNEKDALIFNSQFDEDVQDVLSTIKSEIDQKVYDRNDILKKDAYFEQTVMQQINNGLDKLSIKNTREDRVFIQRLLTMEYMNQYRETYAMI